MTTEQTWYDPPVAQLLNLGDPRQQNEHARGQWQDYQLLGLTEADVPELIRMVTDQHLHRAVSPESTVWAPLHAWRALAQLRAAEAVEPLLSILDPLDADNDDWYLEDLPDVFAMIGPVAIAPLAKYLADSTKRLYPRIAVAHGLSKIACDHPEAREQSVAHLSAQLARFEENDVTLNAFLISHLLPLQATEAAEVVERAYAARRVDEWVVGDWSTVRQELGVPGLGLVPDRPEPSKRPAPFISREALLAPSSGNRPSRGQARAKRKRQREDRRRGRRR